MGNDKRSVVSARQKNLIRIRDLPNPTIICDKDLKIVYASKSFEDVSGLNVSKLLKHPVVYELLPLATQQLTKEFLELFLTSTERLTEHRTRWRDQVGKERILLWHIAKYHRGNKLMLISQATDISPSEEEQAKLLTDSLTGLYKTKVFEMTLEAQLAQLARGSERSFAVINIDLDHFQRFNHAHGSEKAKRLLVLTASRLNQAVRSGDVTFRFGSDKFGVILTGLAQPHDALKVAEKILSAISVPMDLDGQSVVVTAAIGLVVPNPTDTVDVVVIHADQAMHRAKSTGGNRVVMYDEQMNVEARAEIELESNLRRAILEPNKWFELHYMPIVSLNTGHIIKFEALIRMKNPEMPQMIIMPMDFIHIAENTGLIVPIGQWVLKEACRVLKLWQTRAYKHKVSMTVNVSVKEIEREDYVSKFKEIVDASGVDPSFLRIEITETVAIARQQVVAGVLNELSEFRVDSLIDDFGAGHTTLPLLASLPATAIKLDMSMVSDVHLNPRKKTVLTHLVAMGTELEKTMISEGVELAEQAHTMMNMKCQMAQGYWFEQPVDEFNAERMIENQPFIKQVMKLKKIA